MVNRRGFVGTIAAFLGALTHRAVAQEETKVIAPETHPQLYWEVRYICPKGHERSTYHLREFFNPLTVSSAYSDRCFDCYQEWLVKTFPPGSYVGYEPVDVDRLRLQRAQDNLSVVTI